MVSRVFHQFESITLATKHESKTKELRSEYVCLVDVARSGNKKKSKFHPPNSYHPKGAVMSIYVCVYIYNT